MLIPKFIPLYPSLLNDGYGLVESSILGYLDFFQANNKEFSCSNEELAEVLNVSERTIATAIKNLDEKWDVVITKKMREWGWILRIIQLVENCTLQNAKFALSKMQNLHSHNIIQEYINNNVPFETFRTEYPHARKWKKAESKKYYDKLNSEEVMKQVHILKRKIRAWLQDWQYIPACERWIRDFTPLNEDVVKQDLVRICKWHLNAWWDMKQRSMELKETFGEQQINEIVKAIQQKDSPKNLFIKQP